MNYATIKEHDTANGIGVRVSLFVSGCTHHCKECFNQEAWDFNYGEPYTPEIEEKVLNLLDRPYIKGLSLLGGEPFEPANQLELVNLVKKAKKRFPDKTIWCYSGYTFDKDLIPGGRAYTKVTDEMLGCIDVLVDGEFVLALKDLKLHFRGSSNQRIIDVPASLKKKKVITLDL